MRPRRTSCHVHPPGEAPRSTAVIPARIRVPAASSPRRTRSASASLSVEREGRPVRHAQARDAHRPRRARVDARGADMARRAAHEEDVQPLGRGRIVHGDPRRGKRAAQVRLERAQQRRQRLAVVGVGRFHEQLAEAAAQRGCRGGDGRGAVAHRQVGEGVRRSARPGAGTRGWSRRGAARSPPRRLAGGGTPRRRFPGVPSRSPPGPPLPRAR